MKKNYLLLTTLLLTKLASAYGESYGKIIGGIYVDTELVAASIIFIAFFAAILIATRKMNLLKNDMVRIITSLAISAFAILGLNKIGLNYSNIITDIGLERFFMENLPLIILALILIFSIWWGLSKTIMVLGGIIFSAGILGMFNKDFVFNWQITLLVGAVIFIIGYAIKTRIKVKDNIFKSPRQKRKKIKELQKTYSKLSKKGKHHKAKVILEQIKYLEQN
jgi:NADH:ubiquinone oxidoreductase subunit 6 (subunit J)